MSAVSVAYRAIQVPLVHECLYQVRYGQAQRDSYCYHRIRFSVLGTATQSISSLQVRRTVWAL